MKIEIEIHQADCDKIINYLEDVYILLADKLEAGKNVQRNTERINANDLLLDIFKGARDKNEIDSQPNKMKAIELNPEEIQYLQLRLEIYRGANEYSIERLNKDDYSTGNIISLSKTKLNNRINTQILEKLL